ncbi:cytochrome P450 [Leminorella richardii]|nr:cytochrome P450 [Leminorella richardii]
MKESVSVQCSSEDICHLLYSLARERNGQNVWLELNDVPTLIVQNAADADYVLRRNYVNYEKNMAWFRQALGASRFFENGDAWKKHKNLTQPFLNNFNDADVVKYSIQYGQRALKQFLQADGETLDDRTFREMAMAVLIESFFSLSLEDVALDVEPIAQLMAYSSEFSFIPAGESGLAKRRKLVQLRALRYHVRDSLAVFRQTGVTSPMLARMLRAESEPGSQIVLEDELMTFLAAGSESTAAAMGWVCYSLARHPEVQEKLYREVSACTTPSRWEDLSQMPGLMAFISEVMRLYPPIPVIIRQSLNADRIGSEAISEKENILVSFIGILHDERRYPNPWEMNLREPPYSPLADKESALHIAFSRGPRLCGGKDFALVEMAGFVHTFIKHATFSLTSEAAPEFLWRSQMLCRGSQPVRVAHRER